MMDASLLSTLVRIANLAPSVHNTQPTRWSISKEGGMQTIRLHADADRRLTVGDPTGRDLLVSLGTALQGTLYVLQVMDHTGHVSDPSAFDLGAGGLQPIVEIAIGRSGERIDELGAVQSSRVTWRRRFSPTDPSTALAMTKILDGHDDATLISDGRALSNFSELNDDASLRFFRNDAYRQELLSWMRTTRGHRCFGADGLSYRALGMSAFEGMAAGGLLQSPLFGMVDGLGLAMAMVGEKSRTESALCMVAFHRPMDEHPVHTGQALYRLQLELARIGLQTWPMSVLADDPLSCEIVSDHLAIPEDRRLITVWRVGSIPGGSKPARERLPASKLIVADEAQTSF